MVMWEPPTLYARIGIGITNVHSGIFHNSLKVEVTQMSINERKDNNMVSVYTTEYYSSIKRNDT